MSLHSGNFCISNCIPFISCKLKKYHVKKHQETSRSWLILYSLKTLRCYVSKEKIPPARTEKDKKLVTESGLSRNTPVSSTWIEPLYLASFLIFMVIFNSDILKYWSRRLNELALQFKDLISPLSINSIHCTSLKIKLIKLSGGAVSRIKPWIWKMKTGRNF